MTNLAQAAPLMNALLLAASVSDFQTGRGRRRAEALFPVSEMVPD